MSCVNFLRISLLFFAFVNILWRTCNCYHKQIKLQNFRLIDRFVFLSSGWGLDAAPECVRDDELMDITERLPAGHCKPQGRSSDPHTGALPPHIWQHHTHFQVGYITTYTDMCRSYKHNTTLTVLCTLFSLWNIPVTYVNDSCSLAPECRQVFTLKTKSGKSQVFIFYIKSQNLGCNVKLYIFGCVYVFVCVFRHS